MKPFFTNSKRALVLFFLSIFLLSEPIIPIVNALSPDSSSSITEQHEDNLSINHIKMGVPVVDGIVDDIYNDSLSLSVGTGVNALGTDWYGDHGIIHFLYSENYLYICAEIKDNSVVSAGEVYVAGVNPCNNDCCEFRLSLNGGIDTFKVGIDAYGLRAYGLAADEQRIDYSKIIYATTYNDSVENSGYIIEVAIPCTEGILDMHTAGELGFKLQLNDLDYDGTIKQFATDYSGEGAKGLVFYELSSQIVPGSVAGGDNNLSGEGDSPDVAEIDYTVLSFDIGNYVLGSTGTFFENRSDGTIDVSYAGTNNPETAYRFQTKFQTSSHYDQEYKYVSVLYSASNPDGVDSVTMKLANTGAPNGTLVLSSEVTNTNGRFVFSSPCELTDEFTARLDVPAWVQLRFLTAISGGSYRVKGLYFFKTLEDANTFANQGDDYQKLSFSTPGNYVLEETVGHVTRNTATGSIDINCAGTTNPETAYRCQAKFQTSDHYSQEYKYMRVLYSAENPSGVDSVTMKLANSGAPYGTLTITNNVINTNGEFVLSSPVELTNEFTSRLDTPAWVQLRFLTTENGGCYQIKALYFFKTIESANTFDLSIDSPQDNTIHVNGINLSAYRIVVPVTGFGKEMAYAEVLQEQINEICGITLPIVYETTEETDYEILLGNTNRLESQAYYQFGGRFHPSYSKFSTAEYRVDRNNNKIIISSAIAPGLEKAIELFIYKIQHAEHPVNLTAECICSSYMIFTSTSWVDVSNVPDPICYEDSFDSETGCWAYDSEKEHWAITIDGDNSVFSSSNSSLSLSYLHVFEKNVSYEAKVKVSSSSDGSMALLIRQTADDAYVKVGYDFADGVWFIDSREGKDFLNYRLASIHETLTLGRWISRIYPKMASLFPIWNPVRGRISLCKWQKKVLFY